MTTTQIRHFLDGNGVRWRVHPDGSVQIKYVNDEAWTESAATLAWLIEHEHIAEEG